MRTFASSLILTGEGEGRDGLGAGGEEDAGALVQGGAGRRDVVDQEDAPAGDRGRVPDPEGAGDVTVPLVDAGALGLRRRRPPPLQRLVNRPIEGGSDLAREQRRLVEAALAAAAAAARQRNGLDQVDRRPLALQRDHRGGEGGREGALAAVLEGVDEAVDLSLVEEGRPQRREGGRLDVAVRAGGAVDRHPAGVAATAVGGREAGAASQAEEDAAATTEGAARRVEQVDGDAAEPGKRGDRAHEQDEYTAAAQPSG